MGVFSAEEGKPVWSKKCEDVPGRETILDVRGDRIAAAGHDSDGAWTLGVYRLRDADAR